MPSTYSGQIAETSTRLCRGRPRHPIASMVQSPLESLASEVTPLGSIVA